MPPFHDVRVRQAMRLLVDREQLIDSALDGHGTVANDVFSPFERDFDAGLIRHTDVAQARFLLKQAGQENLTMTLTTSQIATGTVAMATVLAEQAKAAGVKINLSTVPSGTFFGKQYLSWPFAQDYYNYYPYLPQVATSMLAGAPFNETHTNDPGYTKLYDQANATASGSALEKEILYEMQNFDFSKGGYIIPAYVDALDAYSTKIAGIPGGQDRAAFVELRHGALVLRLTASRRWRRPSRRSPGHPEQDLPRHAAAGPGSGAPPRPGSSGTSCPPGP